MIPGSEKHYEDVDGRWPGEVSMRIPIPVEQPKIFRLSTPMHLLGKLRWEIAGFQRSLYSKSLHRHLLPAYHAFNCAVTAWHMTDWIWEYAGAEFQAQYKIDERASLLAFQDAMAQESRAVNACREIANGAKHRDVRRKRADPHVRAVSAWAELKPSRTGTRRFGTIWVITDQFGTRPALDVFKEAAEHWHRFLALWREDTFVTGRPIRRIRR